MKFSITTILALFTFVLSNAQPFEKINPENVEIIRDEWGVPHIFGNTDAEVAYGLAWANAEDAFYEMQELILIGKGLMGRAQGKEGAKADFFRHVIQAEQLVDEKMKDMPQDFLKYLDGFVQGANAYAHKNFHELRMKQAFPVTSKDVLTSYVVALSFMTGASGAMEKIYDGKLDEIPVMGLGSNVFAINGNKSANGNTYLCINPHLQMEGVFSFYEAHLNSNEGLNVHGALFPGGTSVFMGANQHLGWGMTWNHFDAGDIFKLEMHPKKKLTYKYDGKWLKLKKERVWLKVKVGFATIPVPKVSYISEIGPTLQSKNGEFYAFKFPAFLDISAPLQWYKMDKATNYEEFRTALDIKGVSLFNIGYADKEGNIYYLNGGQVPLRSDELSSQEVIAGNTSENVWQRLRNIDELPHVLNPDCGYVLNTNNTPFKATCEGENDIPTNYPKHVNQRPGNNNRATVLSTFFENNDNITFEEFKAIKFDNSYSKNSYLVKNFDPIFALNPADYPDIEKMLSYFQTWDLEADFDDFKASIVMVTVDFIFKEKGYGDKQFILGYDVSVEEFLEGMRSAQEWFLKHYGKVEVPLGQIFVGRRGSNEIMSPGFPDALAANYGERKDGKYVLKYGDTYTQFVEFNKDGVVNMSTLVPFGNSYVEGRYSYFNQAELFKNQETKKMTFDKETIMNNAMYRYHPR